MKSLKWMLVFTILFQASTLMAKDKTSVLVVRGGHQYDTPDFENMCEKLKGVDADLVLTAHFQSMEPKAIADKYDAILFLNQNKHYPEYASNKKHLMELTNLGVGMVFLHFTLSSYPEWDEFHDLVGGKWFLKKYTKDKNLVSTYKINIPLDVKILDPTHPVTKGLKDFQLTDTYYGNIWMSSSIQPLLGVDDPEIEKNIAWTHEYNKSKVVYIMPGFSKTAYENPSYKKLISNSLIYVGN